MLYDRIKQYLLEKLPADYVVCYNTDTASTANKAVVITEYSGTPLNDTTFASIRGVQIIVRNTDAGDGYRDMWHLYREMVTSHEYRVDNFWMQYKVKNGPVNMGLDKRGHQRYVMNITIITDNMEE